MKMRFITPLLAGGLWTALALLELNAADQNWPVYHGDKTSSHFSSLTQIDPQNVSKLEVAWTYHAGDARADYRSQIQCNPLVIDGVLYGTSAQSKLLALDAATGQERWRFDPVV